MNTEAILYRKWKTDKNRSDLIIGYWAEDDNPYEITVPCQLREEIVYLQNQAVDIELAKKPKRKVCSCCGGKGFTIVSARKGSLIIKPKPKCDRTEDCGEYC